jgi:hypothetical protein
MGKWYIHVVMGDSAEEFVSASFSDDSWNDRKLDSLFELWEDDFSLDELAGKLGVSVFRVATQVIKNDLIVFDEQFTDAVNSFYENSI